ncbi:MAG: 3-methyl-2-oxobutanoate dehydrogenase subunit beta, partial [Ruminiclostridium sp.]|nr:3-methyl-2-oxobutanoate dehydrogenase subunit beta [Ruminiclostridium sp.]
QRGGPGLGGIQPSQADYWQVTHALGHGDFHALVFAPASVQEMVDTVTKAFDLADEYRMPAVILADGLLGQMMEPVAFEDVEIKMSDASDKPWAASGHGGKRKHTIINSLYLKPDELEDKVRERFARYEDVKAKHTEAVCDYCDDAETVVIAYGSTARLAKSAVEAARKEGIKAGIVRPVTLWPFPVNEINEACKNAKNVLVVEMSMGQMVEDVKLALNCSKPVEFYGRTGGIIPKPAEILAKIKEMGGKN